MRGRHKAIRNERGMISFMVTTVLVLVVGLILVGFSQSARRNQRETLDRQLSTQAFYAAESGVNAVASVIKNNMDTGTSIPTKTTCPSNADYTNSVLSPGVEVTCTLVNSSLTSLNYSDVTENSATFVPAVSANGTAISRILLQWQSKTGSATPSNGCGASVSLPARSAYPNSCGYGVLRVDLTRSTSGNTTDFAMSHFFKPFTTNAPAPSEPFAPGAGSISGSSCNNTNCRAYITGLNSTAYFLRIRSIYKNSSLTVSALDASGNVVPLSGQAMVDVTAKAQDVLRRIQVRLPLYQARSSVPLYGIESTESVCKRYSVAPGFYDSDSAVPECN